MNEDTHQLAPPGIVLGVSTPTAPAPAQPSWGRVLATTIKVWVSWRLRSVGFGRQRESGQPRRKRLRWLPAASVLAVATVITIAALQFAGVFTATVAPAAPAHSAGLPVGNAGLPGTSGQAAAAQAEAATWIAAQVGTNAIIACDPAMCAALAALGVTAGRLMPLQPGTANPHGASVVVTSNSAMSQLANQYAPAMVASFGSGNTRIDVRATEPGGAAAYESALRADLAVRKSAGSQLLRNPDVQFTAQDAAQLRAAEVDSRLLATLAALSSQYSFHVTAFGDASPGVQVLFRDVTITSGGGRNGATELAAVLALVNEQHPPYLPARATIIDPVGGRAALRIEFAAPSPLGLLTAVLAVNSQPAGAHASAVASGRH